MITSVFPPTNLVINAFTRTPAAAAKFVLIKIVEIAEASANVPSAN